MERPDVKPGVWITVAGKVSAVVCTVYPEEANEDLEVVYFDTKGMEINEDVKWTDEGWNFSTQGPCGGYAKNSQRLASHVATLRRGQFSQ